MILVEGGQGGIQIGHVLPGGGDEHLLYVSQGSATLEEQLVGVVEAGRVGQARLEEGKDIGETIAPHSGGSSPLPGFHPGTVGLDGVDLPVVGQHPEGLGVLPGRKGVGGEPLMKDGEGRLETRIAKIPVEVGDMAGGEQPLVDDGPAGRRGYGQTRHLGAFDPLPCQVEGPFQLVAGGLTGDEGLLDEGENPPGVLSEHRRVDGYSPPQQKLETFGFEGLTYDRPRRTGLHRWQEAHDDPEPFRIDGETMGAELPFDQTPRDLGEQPGAVAGTVGGTGTTVVEITQALHGQTRQPVGRGTVAGRNEANATGVSIASESEAVSQLLPLFGSEAF